ncbi:serine/threonine-protein kinase [Streptomyces qinzhouensis]|uniref:serine/threonine-protein kinase n=1 Tax=Streptomyces qinzhouensis TaxID=2599401 RepID=UPI002482A353|nr:serine/threonine-protein kinase [Streptomyces qinzhouensis]
MENRQNAGGGLVLAGRYRLGDCIGKGGMGRVWRARDEVLHRVVAVKELTAGIYAAEADRVLLHARTQKEARAAARITHPNVVTVHDVLEHDGRPWIVMQYVEGRSLADEVKKSGKVPPLEAARIGLRVLGALGAAHAAGVLHRDVKPANVLLARDGSVLLTDFGIAAIDGDSTITRTGEIVGSIDYVAPERVRGGDPGPACDLWSLGVTLYAALTGESPYRRTSPLDTMRAVVSEEPRHPAGVGPLGPIVMALLAKDPETRPAAAEAERLLAAAVVELESTGGAPGPDRPATAATTVLPPDSADRTGRSSGTDSFPDADVFLAADGSPDGSRGTGRGRGLGRDTSPGGSGSGQPPATPTAVAPVTPAGPPAPEPGRRGRKAAARAAGTGGRRGGRMRLAAIVVALAAFVGAVAGVLAMRYADSGDDPDRTDRKPGAVTAGGGPTPGSPTGGGPSASAGASPAEQIPDGWKRVKDPLGFSLLLPEKWQRMSEKDNQVDYSPDGGLHRLRVGVAETPRFPDPYDHLVTIERELSKLPDYRQLSLDRNTFQGRKDAALLEFRWTEKGKFGGPRRAVDQFYIDEGGTEYALFLAGPAGSWDSFRADYDGILKGWRGRGAG